MEKYNPSAIEKKWQKRWNESKLFKTHLDKLGKNQYVLEMFPYPSGKIHMGHVRNYTIGDTIARFKMMNGYNVFHPIGFDAFGMPAENAAIAHNIEPKKWTLDNIKQMEEELKTLGFSYDWDREVITCLPEYYRWEQKIFIEMYKKGMAYRKKSSANYCGSCHTVLANEQVVDDKCWRCGGEVEKKSFYQWFFRVTDYAEELLSDMDQLKEWPEKVLTMQRHWIGKSYGTMINFKVAGSDNQSFDLFTTRPDTIYGVTFISISPLHPKLAEIIKNNPQEKVVKQFAERSAMGTTSEAELATREKEGVFTGIYLINPLNNEQIPLYAANFVVMDYATGVVMGVPAHDKRDYDFAKKYDIPIKYVILPDFDIPKDVAYTGSGKLVNSDRFSRMDNKTAKNEITKFLENNKKGRKITQYRLRDWNISRQRYWGAPIPIVYCDHCGIVTIPEKELPVLLPDYVNITGVGGSPLDEVKSFVKIYCPKCGMPARRETDTFDTFVESSWYFLRYLSPKSDTEPFNKTIANKWISVDQYIGGIEHAVMHLLYARYFMKVLRDLGFIDKDEPFKRLLTQGMVIKDGAKMSKSKGNVVDPGKLISRFGADTARLFSLFAAPPEKDLDWSDDGVAGSYRFLNRVWNLLLPFTNELHLQKSADAVIYDELSHSSKKFLSFVNRTIEKVTENMEHHHFNTAISKLMELTNEFNQYEIKDKNDRIVAGFAASALIKMLTPMVPHFCEEMWEKFSENKFVSKADWPNYNEDQIFIDQVNIAVTINGKLRDEIQVSPDLEEEKIKLLAAESQKVLRFLNGKPIKRIIVVKNRVVNLVA